MGRTVSIQNDGVRRMRIDVRNKALPFLAAMLCLWAGHASRADIYTCVGPDGAIIYTDAGCPEGTREVERVPEIAPAEPKKLRPQVPLEVRLKRLLDLDRLRVPISLPTVLGIYALMSLWCFIAYYRDKRKAINRQWRTPEATLHLLELLGGWPGGLAAQLTLRHKVKKVAYQAVFWAIGLLHGLVWADVLLDHRLSDAALGLMRRIV